MSIIFLREYDGINRTPSMFGAHAVNYEHTGW